MPGAFTVSLTTVAGNGRRDAYGPQCTRCSSTTTTPDGRSTPRATSGPEIPLTIDLSQPCFSAAGLSVLLASSAAEDAGVRHPQLHGS